MVLSVLIVIGLLVYAALDNLQTPSEELRIGRGLWLAVIVLVPVLGPVAWLVSGRITAPRHSHAQVDHTTEPPSGPVGPDDDLDFLAELGRTQRRRPPTPPKPPKREKPKKPVDEPIDPDAS